MTKVTVYGEEPKEKTELKPIKVIKYLSGKDGGELDGGNISKKLGGISKEIRIIKTNFYKSFGCEFDCVAITDGGQVYLCQFNDGIV